MSKKNLYIVLLLFTNSIHAQKEFNKWYFGVNAGFDFSSSPPGIINDSRIMTVQSSSSICDSSGNLLFYTNGDTIFNRDHEYMLNSNTGAPFDHVSSAVQGSLILPMPGNKNKFYLFHGLSGENIIWLRKDSVMRYSIIDMTGDGGLGEVILRNQSLMKSRSSENFAVTLHNNQSDYWICTSDGVNSLNCTRTVNGQLSSTVNTTKLNHQWKFDPESVKFSPDSKIFFSKLSHKRVGAGIGSWINVMRFDNSTGQFSNRISIRLPGSNIYNIYPEFSQDSRFLYISLASGLDRRIIQYDLSIWDSAIISSAAFTIFSCNITGSNCSQYRGFQLAPDGKIYCFRSNSQWVSVINYPNCKGASCNFAFNGINLKKGYTLEGGPYYPGFWFKTPKPNLGKDTVLCEGDSMILTRKKEGCSQNVWSTGETGNSIIVKQKGWYWLEVAGNNRDSIFVNVGPKFKIYLGSDTAFCGQFSHLLKAGNGYAKYNWNTGETDVQITVNKKGIYSVKVLDSNTCPAGDTIVIDQISKPKIKLSFDTVNCRYAVLSTDSLPGLTYQWSTGYTGQSIQTDQKGWYSVKASHQFCSNTDSILVDRLPKPEFDLGPDTSLCSNIMRLETKEPGKYLWSTLETTSSITVNKPGKYWLTISRNQCAYTDSINLRLCEPMQYFIPNVLTPNNDGVNDLFKVYGSNIDHMQMEIFNRWGEKLLDNSGDNVAWDGTYMEEICMESIYLYKIKLSGKRPGDVVYLKGYIFLMR